MKIFLDDERPCPDGWVLVRWPNEVIAALNIDLLAQKSGKKIDLVTHVSLDHDLGNDDFKAGYGTGYDVLTWIEEKVINEGYIPPHLSVHSSNSSAVQRMQLAIDSINRRKEQ